MAHIEKNAQSDRFIRNDDVIADVVDRWIVIFDQLSYHGSRKQSGRDALDGELGEMNWLAAHWADGKVTPVIKPI